MTHSGLAELSQSPTDDGFVQNPYPFYERARAAGPLFFWKEYGLICTADHATGSAILKDRRLGREVPAELRQPAPAHLADFMAVEAHSMLELEPPRHTRLRGLVLRAFTSRRIAALAPEIAALCHELIDGLPQGGADLLPGFAQKLPVIVIARLLGVPEEMADQLLDWSHRMVAMYQAGRSRAMEEDASAAARDFAAFIREHAQRRRSRPADDLITHLLTAEEEGDRLSPEELVTTCILLLNAGHEATVHTIGNGVKALLDWRAAGCGDDAFAHAMSEDGIQACVEEILRFDPPLHLFTRWVYEDVEIADHRLPRGAQVAVLLGGCNRDPAAWPEPDAFRPDRRGPVNLAFGAGLHFCVGAPLARLEMATALPILFARLPGMRLTGAPRYAPLYHFHGLERLQVVW